MATSRNIPCERMGIHEKQLLAWLSPARLLGFTLWPSRRLQKTVLSVCEKRKAPCDPNPCRNGGVCAESPEGFVCHCPERFGGLYCDSPANFDCVSYSCQEEQICTAGEHVRTSFPLFVLSQWDINKKWHMKINSVLKQDQMASFWRLWRQLIFPAEDELREGVPASSSI